MASWKQLEAAEPELAARVRATFAVRRHATLATVRRDGSPRISGTEVVFGEDGEVHLGMMPGSVKALDLLRDPRLALHCPTEDPPEDDPSAWAGDGKLAGRAVDVSDPERDGAALRFRVDVTEAVHIRVGATGDHLVVEAWHEGRGVERHRRE